MLGPEKIAPLRSGGPHFPRPEVIGANFQLASKTVTGDEGVICGILEAPSDRLTRALNDTEDCPSPQPEHNNLRRRWNLISHMACQIVVPRFELPPFSTWIWQ
jgi:hypothetical protein